jgi:hypothetical protein
VKESKVKEGEIGMRQRCGMEQQQALIKLLAWFEKQTNETQILQYIPQNRVRRNTPLH